jgi:ABC-type transport system involved in multi-copper enzyme maturation permease subunit
MSALVRAEWTKLFTTRTWLGMLLGACLLAGGFAALFTGLAGQDSEDGPGIPAVGTADYAEIVFSVAANASVFLLILGIIGMTQEYRHRTATPTFLTTPRRGRVISAKMLAYALVAVPMALVVLAVTVVVVLVYAGARGHAPSLTSGDNLQTLGASGLVLVVFTVIGVGVGALVRNQVGAIVGSLVYLNIVEPIVSSIGAISGLYKWLPGGAVQAITSDFQAPDLLEPWQGTILLLAYGGVAALIGTWLASRRDVV